MDIRIVAIFFALCMPLSALAQGDGAAPAQGSKDQPEEVLITGKRIILKQMWQAEKNAYDIFNKFNDEKRFNISCSVHAPTGTHFERQLCQPNFESEAMAAHGRDYFANLYDLLDPGSVPNSSPTQYLGIEGIIASQQAAYHRKLKQVAVEHPEFLEAITQYSKIREKYKKTTTSEGDNKD